MAGRHAGRGTERVFDVITVSGPRTWFVNGIAYYPGRAVKPRFASGGRDGDDRIDLSAPVDPELH